MPPKSENLPSVQLVFHEISCKSIAASLQLFNSKLLRLQDFETGCRQALWVKLVKARNAMNEKEKSLNTLRCSVYVASSHSES